MSYKPEKIYADRDSMQLDIDGNYYCRHVGAMTSEGLHSKSDIADELAWRDREIDRLRADLAKPSEWISVFDRLPEKSGYVLAIHEHCLPFIPMYHKDKYFMDSGVDIVNVTHWQPLPSPPDKETK